MERSIVTICRYICVAALITTIVFSIFVACPGEAYSVDIEFAWSPNNEEDLMGYRLFYRQDGEDYDYGNPAWEGNHTTGTIQHLDAGTVYCFVARAFDTSGNESTDSNEVCYQFSETDPSLKSLSIVGPDWIDEGNTAAFLAIAEFLDGSSQVVTESADWRVISPHATISAEGILATSPVESDQFITITASYTDIGLDFETATWTLTIVDQVEDLDGDDDGMPDSWENAYGLDSLVNDANGDADGDWLDNLAEYQNITNPTTGDTDGDGLLDGLEVAYGLDPNDPESRPLSPLMEVGTLSIDDNWTPVDFPTPFLDPVLVAKPPSHNGGQPAVIRIRNVDTHNFEIRIQEWEYLNGGHKVELADYLVMERGSYTLPGGVHVEADRFEINRLSSWRAVLFQNPLQEVPVVVAGVTTFNEPATVTGRLRNITVHGFEFRMQEQELGDDNDSVETISYIAWEPSWGSVAGLNFEVGTTENAVKHTPYPIQFDQAYTDVPKFIADLQTADGKNTASLRWENKDPFGVEIFVEEEKSLDSETRHTTETAGYMVFCDEN